MTENKKETKMMIQNFIEAQDTELSFNTIYQYSTRLSNIFDSLGIEYSGGIIAVKNHKKELTKYIRNEAKTKSKRSAEATAGTLSSWVKILSDCPMKTIPATKNGKPNPHQCECTECKLKNYFAVIRDKYFKDYQHKLDHHLPRSKKQKKNLITLDEAKEVLEKVRLTKNLKHELLVSLYVLQPPIRNDYALMKIISGEDEKDICECCDDGNFLVVKPRSMKIILQDYKTMKHSGRKDIAVTKPLAKVIRKYIKRYGGEYLLTNETGTPMTRDQLSKTLTGIFKIHSGKSVGSTLLRNAWASSLNSPSEAIKHEQVSSDMCHSPGMNLGYSISST